MITAKDVQRTFETWLALAKDEEVLTLAALVHRALRGRGYLCEPTFRNPTTGKPNAEAGGIKRPDAGAPP